VTQWWRCCQ